MDYPEQVYTTDITVIMNFICSVDINTNVSGHF